MRIEYLRSRIITKGGPDHYGLSPSGAKRWMSCPASIALSKGIKDESSKYADEGTAAHHMAQCALEYGLDPGDPGNYDILQESVPENYRQYVSPEMAKNLAGYYDYVQTESGTLGNVLTEAKYKHWETDKLGGTIDAVHINKGDNVLRVTDLKYGRGEMVEVEDNPQLMIYAMLAIGPANTGGYESVKLAIVQPRNYDDRGPVRTAEYNVDDLIDWHNKVLMPAVRMALSGTESEPCPSTEACRWCKAKAICPGIYNKMLSAAKEDFKAIADATPPLTGEQVAERLAIADLVSSWADEVKEYAKEGIRRGLEVPGWTVSEAKGAASYTDEDSAMAELSIMYGDKAICRLKTPAQVAKIIGKDEVAPYVTDGSIQYRLRKGKSSAPSVSTASEDFGGNNSVDTIADNVLQDKMSNEYIYCNHKDQRTAVAVCARCKRIKKCKDAINAGITA